MRTSLIHDRPARISHLHRKKYLIGAEKFPTISEAKLRRIVRDELARQHLVNEGFMDAIKSPFKKLKGKVKDEISEKAEKIVQKIGQAMEKLKNMDLVKQVKKFISGMEEAGVGTMEDMISKVPEIKQMSDEMQAVKQIDLKAMIASGGNSTKSESLNYGKFSEQTMLFEECLDQLIDSLGNGKQRLQEVALLAGLSALAGTWWAAQQVVLGIMGLFNMAFKTLSKILKFMKLDKASEACDHIAHSIHSMEDKWLEITVFPAPIQYAAYYAYTKIYKKENPLSYDEFNKEEMDVVDVEDEKGNKKSKLKVTKTKEKESTYKVLKIAFLVSLIFSMLSHLSAYLVDIWHGMLGAAKLASKTSATAGEAGSLLKVAATAGEIA